MNLSQIRKSLLGTFAVLPLLFSTPASAEWGAYLGFNLANMDIVPSTRSENKTSLILGAHYGFEFGEVWTLEPGLQYAQRGFTYYLGTSAIDFSVAYIEVPVVMKARFTTKKDITWVLLGGFDVGVATGNASCAITSDDFCIAGRNLNTFHFGLQAGGGLEIRVNSTERLTVTLKYLYGLTEVAHSSAYELRNRGIEILLGYEF
ncbi:PorT family protein [bacterium]|nr:PorT family protein [bacterium]